MKPLITSANYYESSLPKPKKTVGIKQTKTKHSLYVRFSTKNQIFFVKRLSFLIKAGIPILESLQMIKEQTRSKGHIRIISNIIHDVSNGQKLSSSLSKYRNMFSEFSVNIISFGEETGILSENLEYLAEELKKRQALKRKIIGAFVYPAVVTIATIGITGFLMIYLFPKIIPIFSSIHMDLPLSTRIVMGLSSFLINYGFTALLLLTASIIGFSILLKKNKKVHYYFDYYLLKIPIAGQIIQYYNLANSTRTLGLLLKSGINVSEAMPIAEKTTLNTVYKKEFRNISQLINRGERMSVYLNTRRGLFPDVLSQIISVGERSGNLSDSLIYLSEMFEDEVDDFTKNLSNLIEPMLMIFMGVMVGFIAISIITPIYGITQHLQVK